MTVTPMEAHPGEKVRVIGECRFYGQPGTSLFIGVYPETSEKSFYFELDITTDDGTFGAEVSLPSDALPGGHKLTWACALNDAYFEHGVQKQVFTVLGDAPTSNADSRSAAAAGASANSSANASSDTNGAGTGGTPASDSRGTASSATPTPGAGAPANTPAELAETGATPSTAVTITAIAATGVGAGLLLCGYRRARG
ncbi:MULTISPECIES: hypothetical protein [unclassified Leucobacter]|uniref:hypothetical protein n=1 Tax=unclassified Leucobacter TaxID=2621730 RepID=UPI00117B0BE6|nr:MULTISPECIES: hypothetical protein [unclassified Leucobacter]